ncbi:hypothetical protein SSX86_000580 [Deinandra increscens subsp. villosa]|uniref:VQ domain-containing protein n=1 Tax=Deinandra increscens subsp. villosa TaxID=3103831 RepID=A0AAP0DY60_9ASTR
MDKSCHSSGEESSAINPNLDSGISGNNKDQYLKQIHKLSHKISKPHIRKPFEFDNHHQIHHSPAPAPATVFDESQPSNLHQQHQPPVYNVSKSDFRDVVQKLTGSPAHEKPAAAANPVPPVKPQTSRLHRIRPPPLEHIVNRPPPSNPSFRSNNFFAGQRPLSPLPPLPTVHAAAESPISAYMRCFQTNLTGFIHHPPPPPPQTQAPNSLPPPDFAAPPSPLPFGCLPPMLSPRFPFSPTNQFGFQQLTPLSPTPPAPSPRWKSL